MDIILMLCTYPTISTTSAVDTGPHSTIMKAVKRGFGCVHWHSEF